MSYAEVISLRDTAREARARAAQTGKRQLVWHEDGHPGYGLWSVDSFDRQIDFNLPADSPIRVVAVIHPSGACNFVEAE